jgi:hypothetical protein
MEFSMKFTLALNAEERLNGVLTVFAYQTSETEIDSYDVMSYFTELGYYLGSVTGHYDFAIQLDGESESRKDFKSITTALLSAPDPFRIMDACVEEGLEVEGVDKSDIFVDFDDDYPKSFITFCNE